VSTGGSGATTEETEVGGERAAGATLEGRIGRFEVTGPLGRGGMGVVVAARDVELDRRVAIKVLHASACEPEDVATARLAREAQAMAKLSHPNVVTVYEVGRTGGRAYIAMELVEGQTLRDWLAAQPRPWREILATVVAAGRGLAAAHAVGLVHRDFKPENVLIGVDGRARVSDFGLVSSAPAGAEMLAIPAAATTTFAGALVGTPAYMAPEQWSRQAVDPRTDQFAFAIVAWEALWGARPFPGDAAEIRARAVAGRVEPPAARRGVPRRIEAALRRALSPRPVDRWPDLEALLDELARRSRDRRPLIAAAGAALVLAGAAVAVAARGDASAGSPCKGAGAGVDAIWNPGRWQALEAAFAGVPAEGAAAAWRDTAATIDRWAAGYRAVRIETCELARTRAPGVAEIAGARAACLDRRLTELDGLIATLAAPDPAIVPYARAAAHGLTRAESCLGTQPDLPPASLADRDRLAAAHRDIARAAALRALGKPRDADELGWAQLIAEAHHELGLAYQAIQENQAGETAHQRAAWYADVSHDDALRFVATLGLVRAGLDHSEYDDAGRLLETARMIARRLPPDDRRAVDLASYDASLAYWQGRYGDCIDRSREAIAALEEAFGPDQVDGARLRLRLASCLGRLGRVGERDEPLRRALAIADATTGRDHPLAADVLLQLGATANEEGRSEDALGYYREALAIRERVLGPDSPDVAAVLNNTGNALRDLGRLDEAQASLERAVAIWERAWSPDSPAVAVGSSGLGEVAMDRRDYPAAEAHFRRALEIRLKKRPEGHEDIARARVKLGRALLGQGDRGCLPLLEQAVADLEKNPDIDPEWLRDAREQLAACRARPR
jgi:tetratricopeptide (TPR) repeat protein